MQVTWPRALAWVRKDEGGNDDDPSDHGGRTSRGITQREYDKYRRRKGLPYKDVWQAADPEVDEIYHSDYWDPCCDRIPRGADYLVFDFNVNAGAHRSALLLQQALGVKADGDIGPITLQALAAANEASLIAKFTTEKRAFYSRLAERNPSQNKYLHGWLARADHVHARALSLLQQEQPCPPSTPQSQTSPSKLPPAPPATPSPPSAAPSPQTASYPRPMFRRLSALASWFSALLGLGGRR
jgi:lysozyme family protein